MAGEAATSPESGGSAPAKGGSSLVSTIVAVLVLTIAAAGGGGFLGMQLFGLVDSAVKEKAHAKSETLPEEIAASYSVRSIPPIITNLGNPSSVWLRLEAMLIFDGEMPADAEVLAAQISGDSLAFLRTVQLRQIEGASGLLHLREDLTERAKIRSEGRVKEFVIQALAVE